MVVVVAHRRKVIRCNEQNRFGRIESMLGDRRSRELSVVCEFLFLMCVLWIHTTVEIEEVVVFVRKRYGIPSRRGIDVNRA